MLKVCGVLAVVTVILLITSRQVANGLGADVGGRFLERNPNYDAASLKAWTTAHPGEAACYVWPVLYPLDFLFTLALGGFLLTTSVALSSSPALKPYARLLIVLPIVYLVSDLVEDAVLARLLRAPDAITVSTVRTALTLTTVKIWSVILAGIQVVVLGGVRAAQFAGWL